MQFNSVLLVLSALAVAHADQACITSCESTTASSAGCDVTDLTGCFCATSFPLAVKACLYENSCSSDVGSFYTQYNTACASVSTSTTSVAPAVTSASTDCVSTCEQSAATSLSCDVSDLASCFCTTAFATAVKACLYETTGCSSSVASFYTGHDNTCTSVSVSSETTVASNMATVARPTSIVANVETTSDAVATSHPLATSVSSFAMAPTSTLESKTQTTSLATSLFASYPVSSGSSTPSASTTSSNTTSTATAISFTSGASGLTTRCMTLTAVGLMIIAALL